MKPLFFAPAVHEKVAGYKLPTNPKLWQSEIIRYLKSQHPYLPMDKAEIDIRRMDVANGAAVGSVILENEIAIPVIIKRPKPGSDPELSPMDVFFSKGNYNYLDPEAIRNLTQSPQIGVPETAAESKVTGGNPYIGDMTGDATPLEYSGQASPFAGPFDGSKISADISREFLPEYLLTKTAQIQTPPPERKPPGQDMVDKAMMFGVTGGVGGTVKSLLDPAAGMTRWGSIKKYAPIGLAAGAISGAVLPPVQRALGFQKKIEAEEEGKIRGVLNRVMGKQASWTMSQFTSGVGHVVNHGLTSRLLKTGEFEPNDIENFRTMIATHPQILQGGAQNLGLIDMIARRAPVAGRLPTSIVKYPNIVQVYEEDGRIYIKFSGGPASSTSPGELKRVLRDRYREAMSRLRAGKVYMEHDGVHQVSWDIERPASEAKSVKHDGLYSIRLANGAMATGHVCKALMDIDGQTTPLKLFVAHNGDYAMAGEFFGIRIADKTRLPSKTPAPGMGVFVNYVHGTPVATVPVRLLTTHRVGDRELYVVANSLTGEKMTWTPVSGVQGFERMSVLDPGVRALSQGDVYYMPADSHWVPLAKPIRAAETPEELEKISGLNRDYVHLTHGGGLWYVKEAGDNLTAAEARELLVAMGMDVDSAQGVMDVARERPDDGVKISGLHGPEMRGFEVHEYPRPQFDQATVKFAGALRPGVALVKAAAESGHPETLDALLSLEFITPQNLKYFVDNIPEFEEATTRLAALLIAVRLGMPHVPEAPVKDALEGLAKTVGRLHILQSAMANESAVVK